MKKSKGILSKKENKLYFKSILKGKKYYPQI